MRHVVVVVGPVVAAPAWRNALVTNVVASTDTPTDTTIITRFNLMDVAPSHCSDAILRDERRPAGTRPRQIGPAFNTQPFITPRHGKQQRHRSILSHPWPNGRSQRDRSDEMRARSARTRVRPAAPDGTQRLRRDRRGIPSGCRNG